VFTSSLPRSCACAAHGIWVNPESEADLGFPERARTGHSVQRGGRLAEIEADRVDTYGGPRVHRGSVLAARSWRRGQTRVVMCGPMMPCPG
jgi:hypothetical protein